MLTSAQLDGWVGELVCACDWSECTLITFMIAFHFANIYQHVFSAEHIEYFMKNMMGASIKEEMLLSLLLCVVRLM